MRNPFSSLFRRPIDFWTPARVKALQSRREVYYGSLLMPDDRFEDEFSMEAWEKTRAAAGKAPAIINVYSNAWRPGGLAFPRQNVETIDKLGAVPFIHLNLTSRPHLTNQKDPHYTLEGIIAGQFDAELKSWANAARQWRKPLLVQWGCECNGESFWWTPIHNGGLEKGTYGDPNEYAAPQKFRDAYRHIVTLFRSLAAFNVKWVFHVEGPNGTWGVARSAQMHMLYPGDEFIDVIGCSFYRPWNVVSPINFYRLKTCYEQMCALSPKKPIMLCEFGSKVMLNEEEVESIATPAEWHDSLFNRIQIDFYPRLVAICAWNGAWHNATPGTYSFYDVPSVAEVWKRRVGNNPRILGAHK